MAISNGYATLADVKAAARVTDTFDDGLFEVAIESASRDIDAYCERVFYNAGSLTRVYIPTDIYRLETDDLVSVTTIKSDTNGDGGFNQTWAATDYQLEPLNGIAGGIVTPYTRIRAVGDFLWPVYEPRDINAGQASVEITGVFGFASIPMAIKQATILASLRAYKRYESPTGVLGFSDVGVVRIGRLDPDVQRLIDPYRKFLLA
tara:strand:- start:2647 stop:3261 length:615 start_codon:yes stop_codon:yes gene_type:complete